MGQKGCKAVRKFVKTNIVPALLAVVVFFVSLPFIESIVRIYNSYTPAVVWHYAKALNKIVRPGDILSIEYNATINKVCASDIRAFMIAEDNSVPVRFPNAAGGYIKPSDEPIDIKVNIQIPSKSDLGLAPLKSGHYIYRAIVTRYCANGVEQDSTVPDVKFYLEVPK